MTLPPFTVLSSDLEINVKCNIKHTYIYYIYIYIVCMNINRRLFSGSFVVNLAVGLIDFFSLK